MESEPARVPSELRAPVSEEAPIRVSPLHFVLFGLTVFSMFLTGSFMVPGENPSLLQGWRFAVPLLAILLSHEFGHYIAARLHRVPASLPYFIPLPFLSPFGTMGAVIAMPERIRSRNALLDIGAAGPLAGLVVALPVLAVGLALSPVLPLTGVGGQQEGQSLLYALMKRVFTGEIPAGHDVFLHPTAFAGWAGLFVTMINLLPWGQLDGGHIAFALFGARQQRFARWVRHFLLVLFAYNIWIFTYPVLSKASNMPLGQAFGNSLFWLTWYLLLWFIGRLSGGPDHPPFEPGELTRGRRVVAWLCLAIFCLLFMPTPWAAY